MNFARNLGTLYMGKYLLPSPNRRFESQTTKLSETPPIISYMRP